ncbi:MAG: tRNA lysidine(34) synthetase TilS [Bacillota bacterium]
MDLINDFKEYIRNKSLVSRTDRLLLGVSGGPDSLSMLDLFNRIKEEYNLEIIVFHLNHKFRKNARKEADFVKNFCRERNIKVEIKEYNVPKLIKETNYSIEEAARKIRLKLMLNLAEKFKIKKIALGHNRDDLVETVLLNLFRGTGLKGLTGIDPVSHYKNRKLIHPLLPISRSKIENYCNYRDLNPRRDPSNKEPKYSRNKLRLEVIPYLEKEINSALKEKIAHTASILREEENFLEDQADKLVKTVLINEKENKIILSLKTLKNESRVLVKRILKKMIFKLKETPDDLYFQHYQAMEELIYKSNTNKKIELPGNIRIKKIYDKLILKYGEFNDSYTVFKKVLKVPGMVSLPDSREIKAEFLCDKKNLKSLLRKSNICLCDSEKIEYPLIIRNRKKGDRFQPLGMGGTKKVKDFFIDEKILPQKRDKIPLITDKLDRIIWIAGLRLNEKFKIKNDTEKILKITYF